MQGSRALRLIATLLAAFASLGPMPASAHAAGAAPVAASGSITLGPAVPGNTSNQLHVYVWENLNLPIQVGDTLAYNWSVNDGLGPGIEFTVHNHQNGTYNFVEFRGNALNGTWLVDNNNSIMISFVNPTAYAVDLNYSFVLYAPAITFSPAFFLLPAIGGLAVGWFLWVRAGRPADEGGLDEAYPTDPAAGKRKRARDEEE